MKTKTKSKNRDLSDYNKLSTENSISSGSSNENSNSNSNYSRNNMNVDTLNLNTKFNKDDPYFNQFIRSQIDKEIKEKHDESISDSIHILSNDDSIKINRTKHLIHLYIEHGKNYFRRVYIILAIQFLIANVYSVFTLLFPNNFLQESPLFPKYILAFTFGLLFLIWSYKIKKIQCIYRSPNNIIILAIYSFSLVYLLSCTPKVYTNISISTVTYMCIVTLYFSYVVNKIKINLFKETIIIICGIVVVSIFLLMISKVNVKEVLLSLVIFIIYILTLFACTWKSEFFETRNEGKGPGEIDPIVTPVLIHSVVLFIFLLLFTMICFFLIFVIGVKKNN